MGSSVRRWVLQPPPPLLGLLLFSCSLFFSGLAQECPAPCRCLGERLDCSRLRLREVPALFPSRTVQLDLSHNSLSSINSSSLSHLYNLREIKLNNNELEAIPNLGPISVNITFLSLINNKIMNILPEELKLFQSLETLDLSNNNISVLEMGSFPPLILKNLHISNNRIVSLEPGIFDNLANKLQVLKLNKNRISTIPQKMFKLPHLQHLEMSRNRIKKIDGLTFQGLPSLKSLKIQKNGLVWLMDGAFWGLSNIEILQLDHNNLTEISKGWLYGLLMLQQLHLSQNAISRIRPDAWEFCQKLSELDLTYNNLAKLEDSNFVGLSLLVRLDIGNNKVSYIADGAFRGLSSLQILDLKNNEISWTIEDMNGAFSGLDKLRWLLLQGNRIRSITKKAFSGLDALEHLDLSNNAIMSIQGNTFLQMKNLKELYINTSRLLCDCQLKWLPEWLIDNKFQTFVNATCAHPQALKGRNVFSVSLEGFVCDDFPKPQITVQPETQSAIKGSNLSFICSAASSSDSPMTFAWKKDNELIGDAEMENYAHLRAQGGEVMEYTTILRLHNVEFSNEGKYQCVISNHFGSSYSVKAKLTVNKTPSFLRPLLDRTVMKGETAVLQCIAGGSPSPRLNWTKDDVTLAVTERHFFAAGNQLLIIVDIDFEDAGKYTCEISNTLGTERGNILLSVIPTPTCDSPQNAALSLDDDGWATVGVVIIAVVCCVVGTSLVWVIIIYHTRKRNEDCSVTNTDETNLPADIPSYLSSQGTLAERQDGYGSSENGSQHHFVQSSPMGGYFFQQRQSNGRCHTDSCSENDLEAITDSILCHYLGTSGSLHLKENLCSPEMFETYHTGGNSEQRIACMDLYDSSCLKKKDCYPYIHLSEDPFDRYLSTSRIHMPSNKLIPSIYPPSEEDGIRSSHLNVDTCGFKRNQELSSITPSTTFMGTFGKPIWKPQLDSLPSYKQSSVLQPKASQHYSNESLDFDSESEGGNKMGRTFPEVDNSNFICGQSVENYRTPTFQSFDLTT
ncbi:leucine-rich repeats and immunoglobulin-like domains protein 3 isoform X5 [Ahaetulla prasina]|uniref:leucine-rich repeats and immunoglobulin-like domains protein 3 isoform X5 n=1 Tax=Ahaetulla prasina TaxID=499056 RepID=UPI002647390F|nr:leucine-rich repeats and immunoglobulin-like domains protein 3 isoform X5 [Ahaetulla prasina]